MGNNNETNAWLRSLVLAVVIIGAIFLIPSNVTLDADEVAAAVVVPQAQVSVDSDGIANLVVTKLTETGEDGTSILSSLVTNTDGIVLGQILSEVSTSENEGIVEEILDDEISDNNIQKALNAEGFDVNDDSDITFISWRDLEIDDQDVEDCDYDGTVELKVKWDDDTENQELTKTFELDFVIEDCELESLDGDLDLE